MDGLNWSKYSNNVLKIGHFQMSLHMTNFGTFEAAQNKHLWYDSTYIFKIWYRDEYECFKGKIFLIANNLYIDTSVYL